MVAEHDRQPGHPLGADEADFDTRLVRLHRDDGRDSAFREVNVLDRGRGLLEHEPQWQVDLLKGGPEELKVLRR